MSVLNMALLSMILTAARMLYGVPLDANSRGRFQTPALVHLGLRERHVRGASKKTIIINPSIIFGQIGLLKISAGFRLGIWYHI